MTKIQFGIPPNETNDTDRAKDVEDQEENRSEGTNKPMKISANAVRKARSHAQRFVAMVYCFIIFATGLSIILYCTGKRISETQPSFLVFYSILFITSVIGMLFIMGYVFKNRYATLESIELNRFRALRIVYSMRGEAVNPYLRFGITLFALMSIVYMSCRCVELVQSHEMSGYSASYVAFAILFFLVQTIFLLILHRIVLLVHVRLFSFIFLHILTVNLCMWADAVVKKISKGIKSLETHSHSKHGLEATDYFLPAVPEYCAVALAVMYELSHRIGQLKQIEDHHEKKTTNLHRKMNRGKLGIIFGSLMVVITICITLFLEIKGSEISNARSIVHVSETSAILIAAILFSTLGILGTRKLKFSVNFANQNLDHKLLLVTFLFTITFLVACIVLCVAILASKMAETNRGLIIAHLIGSLLELFQVIWQNYFVQDSFYRCCHDQVYLECKPGQAFIALMSGLNFSLWMIYSFQVKHNSYLFSKSATVATSLGVQSLYILINVTLPMVMLYRYHSSVCFAIAYVRVYEDEVSRYESMFRGERKTHATSYDNKWEILDTNSTEIDPSNELSLNRARVLSEPIFNSTPKTPNATGQVQFLFAESPPPPTPSYQALKSRRPTYFNMEVAKNRVAQSERQHRLTQEKVKKQKQLRDNLAMERANTLKKHGHYKDNNQMLPANSDSILLGRRRSSLPEGLKFNNISQQLASRMTSSTSSISSSNQSTFNRSQI